MSISEVRSALVPVAGTLPAIDPTDLKRLSVYLVEGDNILSASPIDAGGSFSLYVTRSLNRTAGLSAVLGPKGLDAQGLNSQPNLPRVPFTPGEEREPAIIDFSQIDLSREALREIWRGCEDYTVSGTLLASNGCPVPGAEVTVSNVSYGAGGLVATPLETVSTDANGHFTATFPWCHDFNCWPCRPIWWRCWPWWWERDILAVVAQLEAQQRVKALAATQAFAAFSTSVSPLRRPAVADLLIGQGFAASADNGPLVPDDARTALIASKFANPAIREIFPWWWWCSENPNLLFGATQAGNTILQEDPAVNTLWSFASGQMVSLVANEEAISLCPTQSNPPQETFTWTSVGQTLIDDIQYGYAIDSDQSAFAGGLDLYGAFGDPGIPFYQVLAAQWTGNPARGGSETGAYQPLSIALSSTIFILRAATASTPAKVDLDTVALGPFNFGGQNSLYLTTSALTSSYSSIGGSPAALVGIPGIGPFPALHPGDSVIGWANQGLLLAASAAALIGNAPTGAVDLQIAAFDATATPIALETDIPLTLTIDTTGITASILSFKAFTSDGTQVISTSGEGCPTFHIGPGGYVVLEVNVSDPNGHLAHYEIDTEYGHGLTTIPITPACRDYNQLPGTFTLSPLPGSLPGVETGYGAPDINWPAPTPPPTVEPLFLFTGGQDNFQLFPPVSCCYDFQLSVTKRVTDGSNQSTPYVADFWTATIDVSPL